MTGSLEQAMRGGRENVAGAAHQPDRRAGAAQGILLIVGSALPIMGVVLLSPVAVKMEEAISTFPGGSRELGAVALTAPALAIALLAPFAGYLVDRVERRMLLISSLIAYAFVGVLPFWLDNPWAIIAARFALGVVETIIMSAKFTLLTDYYSGAELDRWIAYGGAATAVAATFFYLAGGFLGEISWKAPFLAYSIGLPVALLVAWSIFEPARRQREPVVTAGSPAKMDRGVYYGIVVLMVIGFLGSILFYIVPLQLARFLVARDLTSPAEIGMWIALCGMGNPIGAYAFKYFRKLPMSVLLCGCSLVAAVGLAMAGLSAAPMALIVGAFVNQVGCGLFMPATVAALVRHAPPENLGAISGVRQSVFFIGQFCSPLVVLQAINLGSHTIALFFLAAVNVVFAVVCWFWIRSSGLNRTTMPA